MLQRWFSKSSAMLLALDTFRSEARWTTSPSPPLGLLSRSNFRQGGPNPGQGSELVDSATCRLGARILILTCDPGMLVAAAREDDRGFADVSTAAEAPGRVVVRGRAGVYRDFGNLWVESDLPSRAGPEPVGSVPLVFPESVAMRLCRFRIDGLVLLGFYADDRVVPIDQAAEAYSETEEDELLLPATEELLELLPPLGIGYFEAKRLAEWVEGPAAPPIDEISVPTAELELLTPIPNPPKLLLLAGNYAKHVEERGGIAAEREETFPYVFMKPPSTLTNPGDPIVIPRCSPDHIDWECELGVVIGRSCRNVSEADALSYVAGYTVVNDVSDRKFQPNPGRKPRERDKFFDWMHGKWHDTFCPIGPCILSADAVADPQVFPLRLKVNGEVKQDATTAQMVFPVAAVIAFLSEFVTLEPGDVISTGTPSGVGSATGTYLRPGDEVAATIEGIGTLVNPVIGDL